MHDTAEDARIRRADRWMRVAILGVASVGLSGLALAGFGFWTDRGWAIITGYSMALPLMLVYPAIITVCSFAK